MIWPSLLIRLAKNRYFGTMFLKLHCAVLEILCVFMTTFRVGFVSAWPSLQTSTFHFLGLRGGEAGRRCWNLLICWSWYFVRLTLFRGWRTARYNEVSGISDDICRSEWAAGNSTFRSNGMFFFEFTCLDHFQLESDRQIFSLVWK